MAKKIIIIISAVILAIVIFLLGYYFVSLNPVDKNDDSVVTFVIKPGTSLQSIIDNLDDANLIKSNKTVYLYCKLNKINNFKAGTYELKRSMKPEDIINKIVLGEVKSEVVVVTFIEGKRLSYYVREISNKFGYSEDDIYKVITSEKFIDSLISKYWFITDDVKNKDLYYALEGYLFADTYQFYPDATIEVIIDTMINTMGKKLEPYRSLLESNEYSVHELLSMASIIELEGNSLQDRQIISQVIYSRLKLNMSLGMDVTTYYAVKKDMGDILTYQDLNTINPYNTRNTAMLGKLPVGPICSPSANSIKAAFNPSDTDYLYFYADIKTGKIYFSKTNAEHLRIIKEVG